MKRIQLAVILVFIIFGAVLSAATVYVVVNYGKANQNGVYGLFIVAEELSEKSQTYFTLDNPDAYVSQAIANPGEFVIVGDWGTLKSQT